jgi:hypothetical protein
MNIQKPLQCLGPVEINPLLEALPEPSNPIWDQGSFRNEDLASGAHDSTLNLIRRHEWFNRTGLPNQTLDEAVLEWASSRSNGKSYHFARCRRIGTTSLCSVYEFPITPALDHAIDLCATESVRLLLKEGGVVLRSMVTALPPGQWIKPHRDGGLTPRFAHRIHVPLLGQEGTVYRIGGRRLTMQTGHAYNFNNRWLHSVENVSSTWRINLILDFLEDPTVPNPWARYGWKP